MSPRAGRSALEGSSTPAHRAIRLCAYLLVLVLPAVAAYRYGLSINVTQSMPMGVYHFEPLHPPIARGSIVQVCLPPVISALGRRRGYLPAGSCPDGAAPVLKIVAAIGGDRMDVRDGQILVNANALRGSAGAPMDARGRPLAHVARGRFVLAHGQLWLWTPNPASWDSRYYGPVFERRVLGRATLLIQLAPWSFGDLKP